MSLSLAAANWCQCGLVFLLVWAGTGNLLAKTSVDVSHARITADGRQVLVMLPRDSSREVLQPVRFTLPEGRRIALHETFPKSGVYDAVTLQPVWQVDWFSQKDDMKWSDDFRSVVRRNIGALDLRASWALAFYRDGLPIREYSRHQLLTGLRQGPFFRFTSLDWHSVWYDEFEVLGDRLLLSTARRGLWRGWDRILDLGYQELYTFDLTTGTVLSREIRGRGRLAVMTAGLLALVLALPLGIWLKRRRQVPLQRQRRIP